MTAHTGNGAVETTTQYQFDPSIGPSPSYPDGESCGTATTTAGSIRIVDGRRPDRLHIVKFLGYDEFEQRTRIAFGNDVETRYTYDP